jgi:adenylate cyclase
MICLASIFAGMIYQMLNEGFVDYNAFALGLWIGLGFSSFKYFVIPKVNKAIKTFSLISKITIKAFTYSILIYFLSNIMGLIGGLIEGKAWTEFYISLSSTSQLYLIIYSLIIFSIITFNFHISSLLGKGVLFNLLMGKYHKPVQESRIFMFLDLCSSAAIAEKLDPFEYSSFLKDFFLDIDDAVVESKGAIIQFVGDEVVIVWKVKDGIERNNCVRFFPLAKSRILRKKRYYKDKYGVIPKFKAGLHYGRIVITEIGSTKQEIAYHGDTINTTARIRSECSNFEKDLLISADLLSILENIDVKYNVESVGVSSLKGKQNVIGLFSIKKKGN